MFRQLLGRAQARGTGIRARLVAGTGLLLAGLLAGPLAGAQGTAAPAAHAARIGVVMPKAQLGQGNTGQDVAEPVRQLIMSYMAGPMVEIVPLQARIPAQVEAEARAAACTHVLYASVEQKKGKRGLGSMVGKLAPAAGMLTGAAAMGGNSGAMMTGMATQAVTQAAMQSAQQEAMDNLMHAQAGTVKAKDEITMQYQVVTTDGTKGVVENTLTAKATENGEDLLSPLVEQVATAAINTALAN